jgi:hypothetical protein
MAPRSRTRQEASLAIEGVLSVNGGGRGNQPTMDQELTTYLDGRFSSLAKLVEEHSDSVQREMATGFDRLEAATTRNTKVLVGGCLPLMGASAPASPRACRVPGWSTRAVVGSAQGAPLGRM